MTMMDPFRATCLCFPLQYNDAASMLRLIPNLHGRSSCFCRLCHLLREEEMVEDGTLNQQISHLIQQHVSRQLSRTDCQQDWQASARPIQLCFGTTETETKGASLG